ncbi:MAG: glycosylase [Candidatus Accumulibacter sp. UW20]
MAFKWEKFGLVFDPALHPDRPAWMLGFAQAPNVIVFDHHVRVFFCCRPAPDAFQKYISYCAFVDLDRQNLFDVINMSSHPVLSLGRLGDFDEFGTYPVSVLRDGKQVLAVYGGWTRCESVPFNISLGLARSSDDGVNFEKYGQGPVLSHSPCEPYVVTSPKLRRYGDRWYLAYTAGRRWILGDEGRPEIIYKLRMATSVDGMNWLKVNQDIVESRLGDNEAQACPDIFLANGKYHMFFCYRHGLDFRENRNRSYRIGYASSTDLYTWSRDDDLAGIDVSDDGWDSEMIAYPTVFDLDGSTYMLYVGNGNGKSGFGLARLRGEL